jgi:hypothetical protein
MSSSVTRGFLALAAPLAFYPDTSQAQIYKETVLHSFSSFPDDGATTYGPVSLDSKNHNLYGTTQDGGAIGFSY